jgi:hypothetical protein
MLTRKRKRVIMLIVSSKEKQKDDRVFVQYRQNRGYSSNQLRVERLMVDASNYTLCFSFC